MGKELRAAFGLFVLLVLLTGVVYPAAVLGIGHALFPFQAGGSLVSVNGAMIGSTLIGQAFDGPAYFHSRPSDAGAGYDAVNSSGSNLAPTAAKLLEDVNARVTALKAASNTPIPVDLVTSSASGLDPDISLAAAYFEAPRVAAARHLLPAALLKLINTQAKGRTFGLLGENRVNVLQLNLALDALTSPASQKAGPHGR
ncbi:MAG TPA: potassium-transporting ATPase subunit KdpC [Alphaproteobacteria bacterium]|nr:potassium-transporting ATPase subunit KdpC [Alphaproteobacteria bacterium]